MSSNDNPGMVGQFVTITSDSTRDRRSRAGEINAGRRRYQREHGVTLTLVSKSYSETYGFLSRSAFRYSIERPQSGAYDCPCCGDIVMSDDLGNTPPCRDCQIAGCEPNREGDYDECRKPCATCGDPGNADYYVCAVYQDENGETDYSDGYLCAEHTPTETEARDVLIPHGASLLEYEAREITR